MTEAVENEVVKSKLESMEDLFDLFALDKKRVTGGAPCKIGGTTFMVAKQANPRFQAALQAGYVKIFETFPTGEREGDKYDEAINTHHRQCLAKHVIVGWDTLKFQGVVTEGYDEEVALKLADMDDFMELILGFAGDRKNYKPEITKEDEKN